MFNFSTHLIFLFGFITGILISLLLHEENLSDEQLRTKEYLEFKQKHIRESSFDTLRYGNEKFISESELLFKKINVLCIILVFKEKNFDAVQNTWGKGCNQIVPVRIKKKSSFFPTKQKINEDTWTVLCEELKIIRNIDWVLVANDDAFILLDNLRRFLIGKVASLDYYLGFPVKFLNSVYNSGKAGYIMSRGVIHKLQTMQCGTKITFRNKEDFMLGNQLSLLNITAIHARDEKGFSLFSPYNLYKLLFPEKSRYDLKALDEVKCCSRSMISFNAIEGHKMYTYYYLLYDLQLFYGGDLGNKLPEKHSDDQVWKNFLKKQNYSKSLNVTAEQYFEAWVELIDLPETNRLLQQEKLQNEN